MLSTCQGGEERQLFKVFARGGVDVSRRGCHVGQQVVDLVDACLKVVIVVEKGLKVLLPLVGLLGHAGVEQ